MLPVCIPHSRFTSIIHPPLLVLYSNHTFLDSAPTSLATDLLDLLDPSLSGLDPRLGGIPCPPGPDGNGDHVYTQSGVANTVSSLV